MHRSLLLASLLLLAPAASMFFTAAAAEPTKDSLDTVKQAVADKKALLVDVREQDEWNDGHLRDAMFLPLSELQQKIQDGKLPPELLKQKVIYCHCRAGVRALNAAKLLEKQGYDVRPLKQGYEELVKAGFAVAK